MSWIDDPGRPWNSLNPRLTMATRWSGYDFSQPMPLIDRRSLRLGDIFWSSASYPFEVNAIRFSQHPTGGINPTVWVRDQNGLVEQMEGSVILLQRGATVFGRCVGHTPNKDLEG